MIPSIQYENDNIDEKYNDNSNDDDDDDPSTGGWIRICGDTNIY